MATILHITIYTCVKVTHFIPQIYTMWCVKYIQLKLLYFYLNKYHYQERWEPRDLDFAVEFVINSSLEKMILLSSVRVPIYETRSIEYKTLMIPYYYKMIWFNLHVWTDFLFFFFFFFSNKSKEQNQCHPVARTFPSFFLFSFHGAEGVAETVPLICSVVFFYFSH